MKRLGIAAFLALVALALVVAGAGAKSATAPKNTKEPSITGTPKKGSTLTGNRGAWSGTAPINTSAQWVRCDTNAANCQKIDGATSNTHVLVDADVGSTIRFRVTAKNADGSATADSNATATISSANGEPVNTKAPLISGFAEIGVNLHTSTGTWVGDTPITYSYQWQRCDVAGNACNPIVGSNTANYKVASGDSGHTLRVKVTATNNKGNSSAISDQTALVAGGGGGGTGSAISVSDVPASERLVVDTVSFSPNPVTSRSQPITVKIRVTDTRGKLVRGAYVFLRSTPIVTSTPTDAATDSNGIVVYAITPRSDFPLKTGYSVQFYVKAYRQGDKTLEGIYGSRLVQVATHS